MKKKCARVSRFLHETYLYFIVIWNKFARKQNNQQFYKIIGSRKVNIFFWIYKSIHKTFFFKTFLNITYCYVWDEINNFEWTSLGNVANNLNNILMNALWKSRKLRQQLFHECNLIIIQNSKKKNWFLKEVSFIKVK